MPIYSNPPNMPQFGIFDPRSRHSSLPRSSDSYFVITGTGTAKIVATDTEVYEGPYDAAPSWEYQEFDTHDRIMSSNFAVDSIIKLEAPNDAGGLTLTI